MTKTKKLNYSGIGEVVFASSKRSKRVSITVGAYKPVRVSFPLRVSFTFAKNHFEKHLDWVEKSLAKARVREENCDKICESLPQIDVKFEVNQMHQRLQEFASVYGYCFNKVSFRRQRTRWGSCSSENNISLNINLARLPKHLCNYVLLHELAHTIVKNHGKEFWQELDRTTAGKAKLLDKELGKYTIPRT